MPIDASIALGVKPMQVKSQGEYLNELYNQQNAEQTNQLNQMKMDEYKRGLTEDEAVKNALTRLDRNSPTYEQDRFNAYALKGIEGVKAYAATKKEEAAAEEHAVGTTGKKLTNVKEASAFHRDNLWGVTDAPSAVAWVENLYKDATIGSSLDTMIPKQQMLASIPTDPAQLANWKTQVAMGSKEFAKDRMAKPSNLAILQNEYAALSPNDPNRAAYEAAIRKETLSADMQAYEAAKLQGYKGSIFDYKRDIAKAGSSTSTVVMPPQEKEFEKQVGKDQAEILKTSKASAEDAAQILATNMVGKNLLDKGMLTGVGAQFFTTLNQGLSQAGIDFGFADAAQNSQAYGALMATNTAKIIKQFGAGTGLSDADREYALKAAAGDIKMDEKAIRKILTINNTASQNAINKHNKMVKTVEAKTNTILPYAVEVTDYTAGIPSATDTTAKKGTKTLNKIFGF